MIRIPTEGLPAPFLKAARYIEQAFAPKNLDRVAKAELPPVALPSRIIIVTDDVGGEVPAWNDGTHWRRITDRAVIA